MDRGFIVLKVDDYTLDRLLGLELLRKTNDTLEKKSQDGYGGFRRFGVAPR